MDEKNKASLDAMLDKREAQRKAEERRVADTEAKVRDNTLAFQKLREQLIRPILDDYRNYLEGRNIASEVTSFERSFEKNNPQREGIRLVVRLSGLKRFAQPPRISFELAPGSGEIVVPYTTAVSREQGGSGSYKNIRLEEVSKEAIELILTDWLGKLFK